MNTFFFLLFFMSFSSFVSPRSVIHLMRPDQESLSSSFINTGLYALGAGDKGLRLSLGMPQCGDCRPDGFFSAIDIDTYVGESPFWVGLYNLGGGFTLHRHREYRNGVSSSEGDDGGLRHVEVARERLLGVVYTPLWIGGIAFDGRIGGIDMSVGCGPSTVLMNGGIIPTSHVKYVVRSYGYTPRLSAGRSNMRLFVGGSGVVMATGENREWGVSLTPGQSYEVLGGFQGQIAAVRFGFAGGYRQRSAAQCVMGAEYFTRVSEYKTGAKTMVDPLVVSDALQARFISSYIALSFDNMTLGVSGHTEWPLKTMKINNLFSVVLGCTF